MDATGRADAAAGVAHSFGLMQAGGRLLALRIETLREVIACPEALDPLPMSAAGLCGAVRLRGSIIPVLDLRVVLGSAGAAAGHGSGGAGRAAASGHGRGADERGAASSVIVLMRCHGRLLGLRVDAVQGMAEVAGARLHAFACVAPVAGEIATHSFEVEGGIATVLDAERIAALPGVPMVAEPTVSESDRRRRERGAGQREPMLLFRCGTVPIGVAASSVDATVPRAALRPSSLVSRLCRGVVDHHGHEVPVIDTLRLLGVGAAPEASESALVVLRFPKGLLALMLDEVKDIVGLVPDDVLSLPALGGTTGALLRGMIPGAEGREQHLLLDHEALFREEALVTLASLSRPKARAASTGAAAASAAAGRTYLTYRLGVEVASPLTQLAEILDHPRSGVLPWPGGQSATLGLFEHRGTAVPLVCLGSLLGRPVPLDPATARVLIVECGARRVGFMVQALCTIEVASWEQPATSTAATDAAGNARRLIEVGSEAKRRTLPRLDLAALARTFLGVAPTETETRTRAVVSMPSQAADAAGGHPAMERAVAGEPALLAA